MIDEMTKQIEQHQAELERVSKLSAELHKALNAKHEANYGANAPDHVTLEDILLLYIVQSLQDLAEVAKGIKAELDCMNRTK